MRKLHRAELHFLKRLLLDPGRRKYAFRWLRSLRAGYLLRRREPWLVFEAADNLRRLDLRGAFVFEYGSGGSTLFWLKQGASCVSVEHDPEWYSAVRKRIGSTPNLDYRLVVPEDPPEVPGQSRASDPNAYISTADASRGKTFRAYAMQIDGFPDAHFDVVLVDGRARPSCLKHAYRKVRRGGLLILDNSDRSYYLQKAGAFLSEYFRRDLVGPIAGHPVISTTTFFQRSVDSSGK